MAKRPYFLEWLNNFATDCLKGSPIVEECRPAHSDPECENKGRKYKISEK